MVESGCPTAQKTPPGNKIPSSSDLCNLASDPYEVGWGITHLMGMHKLTSLSSGRPYFVWTSQITDVFLRTCTVDVYLVLRAVWSPDM